MLWMGVKLVVCYGWPAGTWSCKCLYCYKSYTLLPVAWFMTSKQPICWMLPIYGMVTWLIMC